MTIGIDPIIFELGPFEIRWYGIFITLAIVVGFAILARDAGRKGFNKTDIWMSMIWTVIGGIIGARIVHVLDNLDYYIANPGQLFGVQIIGLAIYGGLAGGVLAFTIYFRIKHLPALRLLDCGAVAMPVAQVIGKFANLINGDTWGNPTTMPWGLTYTNPNTMLPKDLLGVPTHPTPIYEQLWLIVVALVVWKVRPKLKGDGQAFILYVIGYSVGRFFISFLRVNNPLWLGLKEAQWIALGAIIVLVPVFIWLGVRAQRAEVAAGISGAGASGAGAGKSGKPQKAGAGFEEGHGTAKAGKTQPSANTQPVSPAPQTGKRKKKRR